MPTLTTSQPSTSSPWGGWSFSDTHGFAAVGSDVRAHIQQALALIADLYQQIVALQAKVAELEAKTTAS